MVNLLRKLFIKDYKNVENPEVRNKHGFLAAMVGIVSNTILVVIKMLIGILSGSISILADSINNLSDVCSSIVNVLGFKMSNKPADKKHPYGHGRIEYIAGLIISIVIIVVAVELLKESITKLVTGANNTNITLVTISVLCISIFIKIWQGFVYLKMSKIINSVSLKTSSKDSFLDSISTLAILVGSLITYFAHINIDGYLGIVVAILILISGIMSVKETADPLIGASVDTDFIKAVLNDIKAYSGVLGVHDPECHLYGPVKCYMSCHVEVDALETLIDAHNLVDKIERELGNKYDIELTIHMDPVDKSSVLLHDVQEVLISTLQCVDKAITIHDVQINKEANITKVCFDCALPNKDINQDEIVSIVKEALATLDGTYDVVINFDYNYLGEVD